MAGDFSVTGADDFLRLSKALKGVEPDLRKALHKGLRDGVKRAMPDAEQKFLALLPYMEKRRGKVLQQVALIKTGVNPGVTVGIRFGTRHSSNARLANSKGLFRHPVFADQEFERKDWKWVNQPISGATNWFVNAYMEAAPEIRAELEGVLEQVADQIVMRAR